MKSALPISLIYKHPFKYLSSRNLMYAVSNQKLLDTDPLTAFLPQTSSVYIGFDPTAQSLHLGNLTGLIALNYFRLAGYNPIILLGGATGQIGDPSGRTTERKQMPTEQVQNNLGMFMNQFKYIINNMDQSMKETYDLSQAQEFKFVNNLDFYQNMNIIDFLREVGVHCRMGSMLSRESVKARMEGGADEGGLSFTEFSYQIFQGYDFYRLRKDYNCRLQLGGSDQWGNIVGGVDLIRRITGGEEAYAATVPLLTNSKGEKYGKSTGNAGSLWLDPQLTTPFDLYQFLLNLPDDEVETFLLKMTFLPTQEVIDVMKEHNVLPDNRVAQKKLARTITEMIHGKDAIAHVLGSVDAFFGINFEKDIGQMTLKDFEKHFLHTEKHRISRPTLKDISSIIVQLGLRKTKSDARRTMKQGGITVNGKIVEEDRQVGEDDLLFDKYIVLKSGKKSFALVEVTN